MTVDEQRAEVCREGMTWELTPFHMNAAIKGVGVDCARLCAAVYTACGLLDPGVMGAVPHFASDWCRHTDDQAYLRIVSANLREVPLPLPGDMAIFKLERIYAHAALVIEWPLVLHVVFRGRVTRADTHIEPLLRMRPVKFFSPFQA